MLSTTTRESLKRELRGRLDAKILSDLKLDRVDTLTAAEREALLDGIDRELARRQGNAASGQAPRLN
jgi:hypothetical protein